jgi:calcineurin-like phosphoesterase family protein
MRKWTSDNHYGHANIIGFCHRPFQASAFEVGLRDVNAMNTAMLRAALDSVADGDELWHLGDVALGTLACTLRYLSLIPAPVTLVAGNHDRVHPCNKGAVNWDGRYYEWAQLAMLWTAPIKVALLDGTLVNVSHFPYAGRDDGMEDRHGHLIRDKFAGFRPADDGSWLLCGHVHDSWRQKGRMINVGVDAWGGRPVGEDEIVKLIAAGPRDLPPLYWEPS